MKSKQKGKVSYSLKVIICAKRLQIRALIQIPKHEFLLQFMFPGSAIVIRILYCVLPSRSPVLLLQVCTCCYKFARATRVARLTSLCVLESSVLSSAGHKLLLFNRFATMPPSSEPSMVFHSVFRIQKSSSKKPYQHLSSSLLLSKKLEVIPLDTSCREIVNILQGV